jgi:hypothetical protein
MNLKHIKDVILENLGDIPRIVEFLFLLTLAFIGCSVGYKIGIFLCGLLGIAI